MLPFININIDGLVKSLKEYQQAQYIVGAPGRPARSSG
jgi:hypothetical protein